MIKKLRTKKRIVKDEKTFADVMMEMADEMLILKSKLNEVIEAVNKNEKKEATN